MIHLHYLPASDAPYVFLIDVDETCFAGLANKIAQAVTASERIMSPVYARWIYKAGTLETILAKARSKICILPTRAGDRNVLN